MKLLRRTWAVTFKEVKQLSRDRLTFAMIVMIPLIQLLLFGFAINNKIRNIPVGLVDQNKTSLSRLIASSIEATNVVDFIKEYQTVGQAKAAIASGEVRAAFIIPFDLPKRMVEKRIYHQNNVTSQFATEEPMLSI